MNAKYISPKLYVATYWLSVYDVIENFMKMFDKCIVFYYSFVNADDKNLYHKQLDGMFNRLKVSQEAKTDILKVQSKLGKKKLIEDGSNWKKNNHKEDILLS